MVDSETLIITASKFNRIKNDAVDMARAKTTVGALGGMTELLRLASDCWDAQKFYANECERLREELRQLRTPSPTTTGEK